MAKTTALLAKYLGLFEKNPTGLVFAPLAETYRKLNMHKEAMEVLKKGLRHHPHYVLGLIVLAHCHFDQGNIEQSFRILSPIVQQEPDNLMLQKLFAQICYKMYAYKDALQAYKNVLFVNPSDEEAKVRIKELEEQEENFYAYMNKTPQNENVEVAKMQPKLTQEELGAWKSLEPQKEIPTVIAKSDDKMVADYLKEVSVDDAQAWTVKQWSVNEVPSVITSNNQPSENDEKTISNANINLDSYRDLSPSEEIPIVTHTLIDIFCSQKHYDKALELLDKVLKNDPSDLRSEQKKQQILLLLNEQKPSSSPKTPAKKTQNEPPKTTTSWNEAKYNMLAQRYGKLLDGLKDIGKSR